MKSKLLCAGMMLIAVLNVKAQATFQGKVTDPKSNPVYNVNLHLLNTLYTTSTNRQGEFTIPNIPAGKYQVEVSGIGYATLVRPIDVKGGGDQVSIQLQTALVQLETVTITADKKEAVIQSAPLSVTAVTAQQVKDYRLWNAKDLAGIVPNLYSGNSGDERNVTSIRGITTTSYDPAVATYVDGVNQFNLDTYIPQLSDIERVEVLRGPQSTLYGRNATGGVINIITKKPTNQTNGFVELSLGNYNQQRYSAGIRVPVIKDKLFFGASGLFNTRDGYYTNEFTSKSFDDQRQASGNFYLKFLPAKQWAITLNQKFQNNVNDGAFPLVNGVEEAFANPYKLSQDAVGRMKDNTSNTSLSINHSGPMIEFTSQSSWQRNYRYYASPLDGDFSPADAVSVINNFGKDWNIVKVFTQEFRVGSPTVSVSKLNWTAGLYLFHQNSPVKQATHFGKDAGLLGIPQSYFSTINTSIAKNTGVAFFAQATYALTEKLKLTGGLRYDYENKKLSVMGEYQPDGQDAIVTRPDTSASNNFNALSPKLGLQYESDANTNFYATYSRGFRTGGLTQLSSDPSQPPLYPYDPEYSNNVEIGIKKIFMDAKLQIHAAAFLTHLTNAQVPTLVLPDAITITKNTGKLTSKGFELEVLATPIPGLQLGYSFGYADANYASLKISSNSQQLDLEGKKQIYTPDVTSMLNAQYSYVLNPAQQLKLVARGEWFYFGRRYFDAANTIRQAPYNLLNTRVGVSLKQYDLYFWLRNITGSKYMEYAYDFGAVHLGTPRTVGVTLAATF
ncbi:MAG: TonB-dependent receptor [Ferruginibacter sp.]|nr:TonB-dependent receptor [Ferruginibacter sp.]